MSIIDTGGWMACCDGFEYGLQICVWLAAALLHNSCDEDSPRESSVIAGVHEQLDPYEIQYQKLVGLSQRFRLAEERSCL